MRWWCCNRKINWSKIVIKKYNLKFLSSGLLYRYASFLILKNKPKNKILFLNKAFKSLDYRKIDKLNLHDPKISEYTTNSKSWKN